MIKNIFLVMTNKINNLNITNLIKKIHKIDI